MLWSGAQRPAGSDEALDVVVGGQAAVLVCAIDAVCAIGGGHGGRISAKDNSM